MISSSVGKVSGGANINNELVASSDVIEISPLFSTAWLGLSSAVSLFLASVCVAISRILPVSSSSNGAISFATACLSEYNRKLL